MGDDAAAPGAGKLEKSYFDVLGICCPSEVPLVEKLLEPLAGVHKVSVVVPSRTVIVLHDASAISQAQIVKALNQARLEASVRAYGGAGQKISNKWPSPYVLICGTLLVVSLFEHLWRPLKWFAVAGTAAGLPPIVLRSIAAARRLTLDVNILMLIADQYKNCQKIGGATLRTSTSSFVNKAWLRVFTPPGHAAAKGQAWPSSRPRGHRAVSEAPSGLALSYINTNMPRRFILLFWLVSSGTRAHLHELHRHASPTISRISKSCSRDKQGQALHDQVLHMDRSTKPHVSRIAQII